jgi:hypothetical protein
MVKVVSAGEAVGGSLAGAVDGADLPGSGVQPVSNTAAAAAPAFSTVRRAVGGVTLQAPRGRRG